MNNRESHSPFIVRCRRLLPSARIAECALSATVLRDPDMGRILELETMCSWTHGPRTIQSLAHSGTMLEEAEEAPGCAVGLSHDPTTNFWSTWRARDASWTTR